MRLFINFNEIFDKGLIFFNGEDLGRVWGGTFYRSISR
jgi:hypothetical protein